MSLDGGLCIRNYADYDNDLYALQFEQALVGDLPPEALWIDENFPTNSHSLYINPNNPPRGFIPGEQLRWCRISSPGEIQDCFDPLYFCKNPLSSVITQGALSNRYFINSLRLLACEVKYIDQLLVSNKYASRGIYTFKFFKCGKWRYVLVDDYIPCHRSGRVYFSRNSNPNETFVMLIEKAYAKLHGCYEAISYGLIDKALHDLCNGAHIGLVKTEQKLLRTICDEVWDVIEENLKEGRLVGCSRLIPEAHNEQSSVRQGVTIGTMYQIVDICIVQAQPTTELDGVTVGMICVRNLQKESGKFTGNWSFDHEYWKMYPDIGESIRHRTREIQYRRGLGPHPDQYDKAKYTLDTYETPYKNTTFVIGEPDTLQLSIINDKNIPKVVQPTAEDLSWIQIEDFVDIFNRFYFIVDKSFHLKFKSKRYQGHWLPGDKTRGSGGVPYLINQSISDTIGNVNDRKILKKINKKPFLIGPKTIQKSSYENTVNPPSYKFHGGVDGRDIETSSSRKESFEPLNPIETSVNGLTNNSTIKPKKITLSVNKDNLSFQTSEEFLEFAINEEPIGIDERSGLNSTDRRNSTISRRPSLKLPDGNLIFNPKFRENPYYLFQINEKATLCISLYQKDNRWSSSRYMDRYSNDTIIMPRNDIVKRVMSYHIAIGFVIYSIDSPDSNDTLIRESFNLHRIVGKSEAIEFSNVTSTYVTLLPGYYVVVPFTYRPVDTLTQFMLNFHYIEGDVEFGTSMTSNKLVKGIDMQSDSEDEETTANQLLNTVRKTQKTGIQQLDEILPPVLRITEEWEYTEDNNERGMLSLYEEIGTISKNISSLQRDMIEMKRNMVNIRDDISSRLLKSESQDEENKADPSSQGKSLKSRKGFFSEKTISPS